MPSGLGMALRVMAAPNSAFARIRDNDGRYFVWSAGIFALGCALSTVAYAAIVGGVAALWAAHALLGGVISTALIYLVGRRLGGNGSWRKVFAAVFYAHVYMVPLFAAVAALTLATEGLAPLDFLGGLGLAGIAGGGTAGVSIDASVGTVSLLAVLLAVTAAFFAWGVVLWVKAVKTVNGFGTAKAFGIVALGWAASIVATMPFNA